MSEMANNRKNIIDSSSSAPKSTQSAQNCSKVQSAKKCPKMSKSYQSVQKRAKWLESAQSCQTSKKSILIFFWDTLYMNCSEQLVVVHRAAAAAI